jgi:hypothetical protein
VAILLVLQLLAGLGAGIPAGFLSRWVYLILLFPVLAGLWLGFWGLLGVLLGRVKNRWVGLAGAVLGATACVTALHLAIYAQAQSDPAPEVGRFLAHLEDRARGGITLNLGPGGPPLLHLGYLATWLYWILEWCVIACLGYLGTRLLADQPLCSACGAWKERYRFGPIQAPDDEAVRSLREGQLNALLAAAKPTKEGNLLIVAWGCPHCGATASVEVELAEVPRAGQAERKLAGAAYTGAALDALAQFTRPVLS